jgi:hypothetical protein
VLTVFKLVGYLYGWSFETQLEMADVSRLGQQWKEVLPGLASSTGKADGYMIASTSFFDDVADAATGAKSYSGMMLSFYDPDQDMSGDRFKMFSVIDGIDVNAPIGEVVKESVRFTMHGIPSFTANT